MFAHRLATRRLRRRERLFPLKIIELHIVFFAIDLKLVLYNNIFTLLVEGCHRALWKETKTPEDGDT